ncbi:very long chain fatty acid elongase AAEL008004-like isoform X1 [Clytia hemisphaerica]|eukprot:TCONS_00023869-protein
MVFEGLVGYYDYILQTGDVRTATMPFIQSPKYVVCAVILYLLMVIFGPRIMEKRQPFQLRNVLIGYNCFSVVFSVWMMWEFFACSVLNPNFNLLCQDVIQADTSPMTMRLVNVHWWYFFSKVIEFLDTLFFVLRKKNKQISFLHVYHHGSMLILQWSLVKYVPGGVSYFGPMLNCFIHTLMYAYYMLSAFGPHMQKYLWWKKYLTRMQMYQFVLIFLHVSNAMTHKYSPNAIPVNVFFWLHWFYMISLFWLFQHFYQNAYRAKKLEESSKSKAE